jgi:hypothetical protein
MRSVPCMMWFVPSAAHLAGASAVLGLSSLGRVAYVRWRQRRDEDFRTFHDLDDPRSKAELWLAVREPRATLWLGAGALLVALVFGVASLAAGLFG